MNNANNAINKDDERHTETPDNLMEDNGDAKETSNREEDLESISWLACRGSGTMWPKCHEINYSKRTKR
jgi:hypothetical protein